MPSDRLAGDGEFARRTAAGHPVGLWFLAFSEAWERFSYYGMQTLLVLYMASHLFVGNRQARVHGFAAFRAALEGLYGPQSTAGLASLVFGLYTGMVYLTPIAGGLLADRALGRTRVIVLGACLMIAGHFAMAFEASFLPALALLAVGTGCFKGNIASQLGALYPADDPRRSRAFQIFYLGISVGAVAAPLVCGTLGEVYGWHLGFGAAGVGMAVGLAIYLAGRRHLPTSEVEPRAQSARSQRTSGDAARIGALLALLPALALLIVPNQQIFNAYLLWGQARYDFVVLGRTVPTTWLVSLDAATSVIFLASTAAFWRAYGRRFREPDEVGKLILSGLLTMAAFGLLSILSIGDSAGGLSLGWAILFHSLNSVAFANMVPVGLSLFTRAAPAALGATAVGIYYVHLFAANNIVGWVGSYSDRVNAPAFWLLHVAIAAAGTVAVVLVGRRFAKALREVR
jgi:proton-dependent oligopeptide transporter, POT family